MKEIIHSSQKVFAKRDGGTKGQLFGYNPTIRGGAERFSTENKLFKPHVQKGYMFSVTNSAILHMLDDISSLATHIFSFQMVRIFDTMITEKSI
jgi:hypothetical protein